MDKKSIAVVIVLAVVVLFYWQILDFLGIYSSPEQPVATEQQPPPDTANQYSSNQQQLSPVQSQQQAATTDALSQVDSTDIDTLPIDTIIIRTNNYTATLSSKGGGAVSIVLNKYTYRDGEPIEMMPESFGAVPNATFAGGSFATSSLSFVASLNPGTYDVTSGTQELTYTWDGPGGGQIVRKFIFHPDSYHFDFELQLLNPDRLGLERNYSLRWDSPLGVTEPIASVDYEAMQAVAMMSGSRESLDDFDDGNLNQSMEGNTSYAGLRSKYFAAVMIPQNRQAEGVSASGKKWSIQTRDGSVEKKDITVGLTMPFANFSGVADSFKVFVGPLDYMLMSDYDVGLEDMLDIGTTPVVGWIIKPFALAIMWLLPIMYGFIPNYGFVIILFGLMVKIITMPLSLKSVKSMQAMKDLAPNIEELKVKHKKNPQALNQEMMKLYKKHGVNPISGCLPMLPQMPLLFAFFSVFRATILLRDAPFVWFITDLSHGATGFTDPYISLVLIMVGAQFLSQQFTMTSTQQNKMMMYMMPVMMGFFLYSLPSGLIIYWICFSLFSMIDYAIFRRGKKNAEIKTA
ncbi:MAG: membrane protein insertase YidC [candidate division Zixibacteria bacterium]